MENMSNALPEDTCECVTLIELSMEEQREITLPEDTYECAILVMVYDFRIFDFIRYPWSNNSFLKEDSPFRKDRALIEKGRDPAFWKQVIALPDEQRLNLGFTYMDEETKAQGKMLMPFWIYACLPIDFEAGGERKRDVMRRVSKDVCSGCVAWLV